MKLSLGLVHLGRRAGLAMLGREWECSLGGCLGWSQIGRRSAGPIVSQSASQSVNSQQFTIPHVTQSRTVSTIQVACSILHARSMGVWTTIQRDQWFSYSPTGNLPMVGDK
jgi:hypothetical protein